MIRTPPVRLFTLLLLVLTLLGTATAQAPAAIGSLYTRDLGGNLDFVCTVSVVHGPDLGLEQSQVLLTAAHCVERSLSYNQSTEEWTTDGDYLVTFNEKSYYSVLLYRVGTLERGYDIAILEFEDDAPLINPLRVGEWDDVRPGTDIYNWANPGGYGLQRFEGYVTRLSFDRPGGPGESNWRGYSLALLPVAGGSSGSLVLDADERVIGVVIGMIVPQGATFTVFVPLSRFDGFLSLDTAGRPITY
jgi:hypothetical protein